MPTEPIYCGFRFRWLVGFDKHLQKHREGGKGSVWRSQTLDTRLKAWVLSLALICLVSLAAPVTPDSTFKDPTFNVAADFQKRQLGAVGKILRGHEESPARLSILLVLELLSRGLLREDETVLKNMPLWDGCLPTPQQLVTMAGGSIDGKPAMDSIPLCELQTFGVSEEPLPVALGITNGVAHTVESKSRRDRAYGERAKQLLLDLPVGGFALFTHTILVSRAPL